MPSSDTDNINRIVKDFHNTISQVLKICRSIEPNNVDLKDIQIKFIRFKDVDPLLIINSCKDRIWQFKDGIINEDEKFFMNSNFTHLYNTDENSEFISGIIDTIKSKFSERSDAEKRKIWDLMKSVLRCVIEYKREIKDFSI